MSILKLKNNHPFSNFNNYKLIDIFQYILLVHIKNYIDAAITLAGSQVRCHIVLHPR